MRARALWLACALFVWVLQSVDAAPSAEGTETDVLQVRRMGLDLARDIADAALASCRDKGYQVSVVVVDRDGLLMVALRDVLASRFNTEIAQRKANATILSGVDSAQFRGNRNDIREEMNHVSGILMLEGGVAIRAAGSLLGAVGVSGAPGGDRDGICAQAGVDGVRDRLQFAD